MLTSITASPHETTAGGVDVAPSAPWALAALSLSMLLSSLGTSVANVALPTLARDFGASFQAVQWVVLAYLLAVTTAVVGAGRLGDLLGRRRLLLAGIALFTAASIACAAAPAIPLLVAARAAQGLGAAVMMALAMAFVAETVPKERTGRAMGLLGTASAVGTALGPSLGGVLIAAAGWRAIFVAVVPLGLAALLLAWRHLPAGRVEGTRTKARFDVAGTLLLALTLTAYALAMTLGRGQFGALQIALLAAAALGAALFARVEASAASPLVAPAILRDGGLRASLAANALVSTVMMATLVVGPFYLDRALGLTPALVGLALSVGPIVTALAGVPAGRAADRFGTRRASLVGLASMAAGAALLSVVSATLGVVGYVAPIAVLTVGYALFQTANNAAVMRDVEDDRRGVVAGVLSLSRNLGLVTGASVMGAIFALASASSDAAAGMQVTFAVAAALVLVALVAVIGPRTAKVGAALVGALVVAPPANAQVSRRTSASSAPSTIAPSPRDPYPVHAAGWGPLAGRGLFVSRWAEDWTLVRAADQAPPLKAIPLGRAVSLTLSAELRVRVDAHHDAQATRGNDFEQGLARAVLGADLRFAPSLRVYGEAATGQVRGRRRAVGANFQNAAALQQLFVDARGHLGAALVGAMVGRQEFADGPRQLVSLSDGPNVHRTWNGARFYAHGRRLRFGAYDLRATRQERGSFDEAIDDRERLRGVNASLVVARDRAGANIHLDPFWIHTERPNVRAGERTGLDDRDTYGARLWGRRGAASFDWTLARQTGRHAGRAVGGWGLFATQGFLLSDAGWRPRLDARVDVASGGGRGSETLGGFHQLYASSSYLGEGQFLSLSNLMMVAPGISASPTPRTNLSFEYGVARRLSERDAAYAGGMRPYAATRGVRGRAIGGLLRVSASHAVGRYLTLFAIHERLAAGDVLDRAGVPSSSYGHAGATLRY